MASSTSTMEETPNWLELPDEIMGGMILQRLGALEILKSAQKVCRNWRRICKDPAMWKKIEIIHYFHFPDKDYVLEKLIKQAVDRSCGKLIDITLKRFCTDDLLDYISRCSSKLTRLRLTACYGITGCGLINALKRLPHLETLKLSYINLCEDHIEEIGQNCPQLKSFTMKTEYMDCYGDIHAIANNMPMLRHLKLVGSTFYNDDEVRAILNGCPRLESLDIRGCFGLDLDRNLEKLCRERIKDFKFKRNNIPEGYEESEMEYVDYDTVDDWHDGRGMDLPEDDGMDGCYGFAGENAFSDEDDYDYYWPEPL
ncbi:hypothetical protein OSB04_001980 [Centaurea solstitialis]|uniref:F-box domain-containing protein n=1 Tax=Centaurea solstitialis TaxID=347529 RepID=A0AA38WUN9_9ASTR|nr:hypothetical protein OSB04_001980 [Centaurea solstitialis]